MTLGVTPLTKIFISPRLRLSWSVAQHQHKIRIKDLESLGHDLVHLSTQVKDIKIIDLWMQGNYLHVVIESSEGVDESRITKEI